MRVLQTLALPLGHDADFKNTERAMGFEPTTFSLARRRSTTELRPHVLAHLSGRECRDPGSNWGHRDFQSRALPTELSRPDIWLLSVRNFTRRTYVLSSNASCSAVCSVLLAWKSHASNLRRSMAPQLPCRRRQVPLTRCRHAHYNLTPALLPCLKA